MKTSLSKYVLISALILCSNGVHARLTSMSAVETIQVDGKSQKQFKANCGTTKFKPTLVHHSDQNLWCDSILTEICEKNKVEAAQAVCSRKYTKGLKTQYQQNQDKPLNSSNLTQEKIDQLKQEAFDIEKRLIDINAAQLELRKQELELIRKQQQSGSALTSQ